LAFSTNGMGSTLMKKGQTAPGPLGDLLWGNLRAFRRDALGLMLEGSRQHGDVVRFRIGPFAVHLLNHPDHIEHVLQSHSRNYDKATRSSAKIRLISGDSLLTSNGETWQRQRRLMQPSFHRQRLVGLGAEIIRLTTAMLERWQFSLAGGQPMDVASEMMRLTYTIVRKTLRGAQVGGDRSGVEHAIETVLTQTFESWGNVIDLPPFLPTPRNFRFRRSMQVLDLIVYRMIAERRPGHDATSDLLPCCSMYATNKLVKV
jgi:enediyne biosynthesis protein E7